MQVAVLARTSFLSGMLWLCWHALPFWVVRSVAMLVRTSFLGGALCGYIGALSLIVGALCGYVGVLSLLVGAHCGCVGTLSFWVARTVAIQKYAPYFQDYIFRLAI